MKNYHLIDPVGHTINELTIVERYAGRGSAERGVWNPLWVCKCNCENPHILLRSTFELMHTMNYCTLAAAAPINDEVGGQLRWTWERISRLARGERENSAEPVTMHQPWMEDFDLFKTNVGEPSAEGFTLVRLDMDKGYEPGNVAWVTKQKKLELINQYQEMAKQREGRKVTISKFEKQF